MPAEGDACPCATSCHAAAAPMLHCSPMQYAWPQHPTCDRVAQLNAPKALIRRSELSPGAEVAACAAAGGVELLDADLPGFRLLLLL